MTTLHDELEAIARRHLGVETLQVQNRDALDFHDVSVWGIEHALRAAFELGAASTIEGVQPCTITLDDLVAALPDHITLTHVHYDERLTPEQLEQLLTGRIFEMDADIYETYMDQRWHYAEQEITETLERVGVARASVPTHVLEDLEQAIIDRDKSAPLDALLRHTDIVAGAVFGRTRDEYGIAGAAAFRIDSATLWDFWWQHDRDPCTYLLVTGDVWAGNFFGEPDLEWTEGRSFLVSAADLEAGWLDGKDGQRLNNGTWEGLAAPVWGRATGEVVTLTDSQADLVRLLLDDEVAGADALAAALAVLAA